MKTGGKIGESPANTLRGCETLYILPWEPRSPCSKMVVSSTDIFSKVVKALAKPEDMVKVLIPSDALTDSSVESMVIDLKQPWLAAILAWMIPGLGHLYQGRTGKGLLFFICIMGTFIYGLYIGGGKVVYAAVPWEQQFRWQYFCQLGVGLPATPMLLQRERMRDGKPPLWNGFMAPPSQSPVKWEDYSGNTATEPNELAMWSVALHPYFEIGTVYTVIAGLLNVLVICDAAAGPLILKPQEKKLEPQLATPKTD